MRTALPFLIALQFLTRLPVRLRETFDNRAVGRSLPCYPVVGAFLGLLLAALCAGLADAPPSLRAALVLSAWAVLTGGMHLDGLADSADAWIGALRNRERSLAIMKDPHCGAAAVVALVLVLMLKFAALVTISPDDAMMLVLVSAVARGSVVLLLLSTPYVRPGGLGTALAMHAPRTAGAVSIVATATGTLWLGRGSGLWMLLACTLVFLLARAAMMRRLGGTTGDTAGALVEIEETAGLIVVSLVSGVEATFRLS